MTDAPIDARPTLLAVAAMPIVPIETGYAVRVNGLVRELAHIWRVTLVVPPGNSSTADLESLGVHRIVPISLFGDWGAPVGHDISVKIRELIDQTIAEDAPEAALVWAHAEIILDNPDLPPTVLDRLDCEVVTAWRAARTARAVKPMLRALRDLAFWAREERKLVRGVAAVVVDGATDASVLRQISGRKTVHVVPNGVETEPSRRRNDELPEPTVVFSGNLSYGPNVVGVKWFVQRVWPTVIRELPTARLRLIGRSPSPAITALGFVDGVDVVGPVSDIFNELRKAWVAVAPMRTGTGVRTKVLEAWSVGTPVVMTGVTASGMRLDVAARSLVASRAGEFSRRVVWLLKDADEPHRLGEACRRQAELNQGGRGP
jgi:glycosyltransferase involved in cell wall biosynthesis